MIRLNKGQLKEIVKECLLEILSEGIVAKTTQSKITPSPRRDVQHQSSKERDDVNENFEKAIKESTKMLTSDPVMASIFENTARTTLQEHINAETAMSPMSIAPESSLFNAKSEDASLEKFDDTNRWAALAFAEVKKR